ncbi:hypothetical protein C8R44DRAFT_641881 [Mycena epipterygia]|nr:hypothetical protein C8R44DRAFT_641881 [Mycena epipterygia]
MPRPPCVFFLRNACVYGDTCRNSHINPNPLPLQSSRPHALKLDVPVTANTPPVCAYFLSGNCRFGDHCREFHPPSNPLGFVQEVPTRPLCRYFTRGSCTKGSDCAFSHDAIPDANAKPSAEIERKDSTPLASTDLSMYNCTVRFGAGATVLHVITPFESPRVLISNIPTSASDAAISAAISSLTIPAEVEVHRSTLTGHATATLVFEDANAAAQAVLIVGGMTIGGNVLSAQLDLRPHAAAEEGKGVVRGRKVKLTWYGRRASAFVHYTDARSAEERSQQLNGKSYRGYILSASFRRPVSIPAHRFRRAPAPLYTVMIRNLPLDTSQIHLKGFCQAKSVALDLPRCPEDSPIKMRHALECFGPVDAFDTLPMTQATAKIIAFAQFQTAGAAAAAESALRAVPPPFLGGTPFFIERTFSVKYSIRRSVFTKIQGALDLLIRLHPSMIRYYLGENGNEPVILVLHGSEPKALGRMKTELDRVVQGELLVVDGQKFWDEFFERIEGQMFLNSLNQDGDVFVQCDCRTRTIRLFGSEAARVQARNLTLETIAAVRARRHVFPLRKDLIRVLLRGRLRELQESLGDRLVLDVVARTLTVNGDDAYVRRVRAELSALESGKAVAVEASPDCTCPVCFCSLEDSVKLACGHLYCRDCLQHYLRPAPGDPGFSPRKCVAEVPLPTEGQNSTIPCGLGIAYNILRTLLTSAEEDLLLRASFLAHVNGHPLDFHYCPSPDCEMVYRPSQTGSSFQCPSCLIQVCPACNVEYHEGMSCAEHQDNLTGGLSALAKWREENNVKQCPNCHADIEKDGGCNHMTCVLCKTHICWVCLKTFSNSGSDGGIYPHMQREHGGHGGY